MKKLRGRKEFNLVLLLLPLWLEAAVSEKSKDKELIIVETSVQEYTTDEGQLDTSYAVDTTRLDVTGWEPGEEFIQLGSYYYPWQGEDSIDWRSEGCLLMVNDKPRGINFNTYVVLGEVYRNDWIDPNSILTAELTLEQLPCLNKLPGVTFLVVGAKWRDTDVAEELHIPSGAVNLKGLELGCIQISDSALASLTAFKDLRWLWLYSNSSITDRGLIFLEGLTNLRFLDLSSTGITDKGLKSVAKLWQLEELDLSDNEITDEGTSALGGLTNLRKLNLKSTWVTESGLAVLQAALPQCDIQIQADGGRFWPSEVIVRPTPTLATFSKFRSNGGVLVPLCEEGDELTSYDILKSRVPKFPKWAKREGISATITIRFSVDTRGHVLSDMLVKQTTGYPRWDLKVMRTLRCWRFIPSDNVEIRPGTITFRFDLL